MQALLASLVVSMGVRDAAFKSGMATARTEAKRTGQEFQKSSKTMEGAVQHAAREVNEAMVRIGQSVASMGQKLQRAGLSLTVGLTVPLGVAGKKAKDTASDFQAAMNGVRSAALTATTEEIDKLGDAALKMGPKFGRSAIETAGAIEMLAKNGLSASQILGGGLESALKLAVVGQADLASAADLTTDILSQFSKSTSDLPEIVNKVSGALDASKLDFKDYQLSVAQAGGAAGGFGRDFNDLNTALAATASYLGKGSDAGTSFRTFLTMLPGSSKEASEIVKQLGVEFYNTDESAKSLSQIAGELNAKFGRLSQLDLEQTMTKVFGTDAMRTAIALTRMGTEGVEKYRTAIDSISADQKLAVLMQGDANASRELASAVEGLSIQLGGVLLPIFTTVKQAAAGAVQWLANLPPAFHYAWVGAGLLAASLGPLTLAAVALSKAALPMLALKLGTIPVVLATIINPLGMVIGLLGRLALQAGAATAVGMLGARLIALATPLGLAVSLLTLLWPLLFRTAKATDATRAAQDAANAALDKGRERTERLKTATEELRKELLAQARQAAKTAQENMKTAVSSMAAARAAYVHAKALSAAQTQASINAGGTVPGMQGAAMRKYADDQLADAGAELRGSIDVVDKWRQALLGAVADIRTASAPQDKLDFEMPEKDKKTREKKGRDAARDEASYLDELGRLRVAELDAQADLTDGIHARYDAEMAAIEEERAAYARSVALDEGLNDAKRQRLLALKDAEIEPRKAAAEQERFRALVEQQYDLDTALRDAKQEELQSQLELADSSAERRRLQLELLDIQRRQADAEVERLLATKATGTAEWSNALKRKDRLDADYARMRAGAVRDTEGPAESYMRDLNRSAAAVGETIEGTAVSAFQRLNDELADSLTGFLKLKGAAGSFVSTIVSGIARIAIEQNIIKPLAGALFGGGGFLKGLFGGATAATSAFDGVNFGADLAAAQGLSYGGGKASGGRVSPGSWYMVGEDGPEPFVPDSAGTIHPNSTLRGGPAAPALIQIVGDEGAAFVPRVAGISGNVSVETVRSANMAAARRGRQRLA